MKPIKLNLGCGRDIRKGWVNLDKYPGEGVDVVYDLNDIPLPFKDKYADYVYCSHCLEHLNDWEPLMIDVFRVLKPKGIFEVVVPKGFKPQPYHRHFFGRQSMDHFTSKDKVKSLEPRVVYDLISLRSPFSRQFPFRYHLVKYLGWKWLPQSFPIGPRNELVWKLRRPA